MLFYITDASETVWNGHLGREATAKHRTGLPDPGKTPINLSWYRADPRPHKLEISETDERLAEEKIEPVNTEWSSLIMFAPRKNGYFCFCVDYQTMYTVTARESNLFLQIEKCIDFLGDEKIFGALDVNADY